MVLYSPHLQDQGVPAASRHARKPVLLALGGAIRRARKERGISQEELALRTEIDRSYMGSIERGDQNLGVIHLATIAEALGMTITELAMEAAI